MPTRMWILLPLSVLPSLVLLAACIIQVRRTRTPGGVLALLGTAGSILVYALGIAIPLIIGHAKLMPDVMNWFYPISRGLGLISAFAFSIGFLLIVLQGRESTTTGCSPILDRADAV